MLPATSHSALAGVREHVKSFVFRVLSAIFYHLASFGQVGTGTSQTMKGRSRGAGLTVSRQACFGDRRALPRSNAQVKFA